MDDADLPVRDAGTRPPGATVIVVRPRAQAGVWVAALAAAGVAARALPLIDILPAPAPARVAEAFGKAVALAAAIGGDAIAGSAEGAGGGAEIDPQADDWRVVDVAPRPLLVFVSPNAVGGFFEALAARGASSSSAAWPAEAWAAATGPGTVAALRAAGVPPHRIAAPGRSAAQFDSEALWSRIAGWRWPGRAVWLVRGNGGREWLGERLREAGALVRVVQAYARAAPTLAPDERALLDAALAAPARWIWMFSASEAVDHLAALAPGADWRAGRALASHPRIAERARALGFPDVGLVAPKPEAVAAAVLAAGSRR